VAHCAPVSMAHCAPCGQVKINMAKLKTNVAQGKFILEFAVILVKQCIETRLMANISVKSIGLLPLSVKYYKALTMF